MAAALKKSASGAAAAMLGLMPRSGLPRAASMPGAKQPPGLSSRLFCACDIFFTAEYNIFLSFSLNFQKKRDILRFQAISDRLGVTVFYI